MKVKSALIICVFSSLYFIRCATHEKSPVQKVKATYSNNLDSFTVALVQLQKSIDTGIEDSVQIRKEFNNARIAYKQIELLVDYYNPGTAKSINGPALYEVEPENPLIPEQPSGFQVMEELLFPIFDRSGLLQLKQQSDVLNSVGTRLKSINETTEFTKEHIWDAIKMSIIRIETLGLSGYDSPIANQSIIEAKFSLKTIDDLIECFEQVDATDSVKQSIQLACDYIDDNNNFNDFNRAVFIAQYLNTCSKLIATCQQKLKISNFNESRLVSSSATNIFEKNVFDPWYFSYSQKDMSNESMVQLGEKLFYSNELSSNNTRNCSSCHNPQKGFTDGLKTNSSFNGVSTIKRNTPTILYAALQPTQFADSRLVYLEDQAKQVIENPNEIHGDLAKTSKLLNQKDDYKIAFKQAFNVDSIAPIQIQTAIAAFIRTKAAFDSPFDEYMRGNSTALNVSQIKGFNLFMGKAKCATCHFMPLFNGTVPPFFSTMESEVLGTPSSAKPPYKIDADSGKYFLYNAPLHMYAFKTPTIRNAALTAPYMHNGVYQTLEEVMDFYNKGGGAGLGIQLENQTLPPDALGLNKSEINDIISFIHALTDKKLD